MGRGIQYSGRQKNTWKGWGQWDTGRQHICMGGSDQRDAFNGGSRGLRAGQQSVGEQAKSMCGGSMAWSGPWEGSQQKTEGTGRRRSRGWPLGLSGPLGYRGSVHTWGVG